MPKNTKSLLFATALCVVCSLLLTASHTGLKSFQQRNMAIDRHKNILLAFGLLSERQSVSSQEIEKLYENYVDMIWVDQSGRIVAEDQRPPTALPLYTYEKENQIQAYVVPVNSRGLWGRIHGYLAIENDGVTVRGFTVYKHSETPGLGGEIESRWFRKNFEGKKIVDQSGDFVSVKIAKGKTQDVVPPEKRPNYVDGISGATMTGQFLSAGLRDILKDYEPVAIRFRQDKTRYLRTR